MSVFGRAVIAATHNPVVRKLVTATPPGRSVAGRFVAGDGLDEATTAALGLHADGLRASLDLLGEEVLDRDMALAATDAYIDAVSRIESAGLDANVSVKLTQLGLSFDRGLAGDALGRLAEAATAAGTSVTIDMEDSRFTEDTVALFEAAQAEHGNLGICLQAYLHRTPEDLDRVAPLGGHVRLCKGAYVEPPEIAYQGTAEVDAAYARLLERLMSFDTVIPAIATHDDRLIERTRILAENRTAPWEFQMLFGVRPQRQLDLRAQDHPVRVYVPYGREWYAYLTRRMAERPANAMFFVRAVAGKR